MDLEEDEDDEDDEEDDNNDDDEEEDDDNNNDDEDDEDDKRERKAGTRCPRPWLLDASDEGRVEAADSRLNREEVREGAFLLRPSNSKLPGEKSSPAPSAANVGSEWYCELGWSQCQRSLSLSHMASELESSWNISSSIV
jgi:hypothetical protein